MALLALDLGVLHCDLREIGVRESLLLSAGYIGVARLFGAFLVLSGIKVWIAPDHKPDIADNPLLKFLRRHLRVTDGLEGQAFIVH